MTDANDINQERLDESDPVVVGMLREEIAREGRITFARFMEIAIYQPEHGYYASDEVRVGTEGDFLTGPETHPIFGWALARQIAECWELLGKPEAFTVREYGAGRGALASSMLTGLQRDHPEAYAVTTYELDDVNEQRLRDALDGLAAEGFSDHVRAASGDAITGVVIANELLDALPFHRLALCGNELHEVYVVWRDGWFADELGPLSNPDLAAPLAGIALVEGQRLEVSPVAREWSRSLPERLGRGYAILIDYGYPATELYSAERADGTLKTYRQHMVGVNPYHHVGRQDITAHVDMTAVSGAARDAGLAELGLTTQAFFFAGLGIEELLMRLQQDATDAYTYVNAREAVMHLIDPRGLGRFRVLMLGHGVDPESRLRGLSFSLR